MKNTWWKVLLPPMGVLVLSMLLAELAVRIGGIPGWLLPPPSRVLTALYDESGLLLSALWGTTQASVIGFVSATVFGVMLAVLLSTTRWVQRAFYPYAIFFQTVPIIAIAPLLVIWFGYGLRTIAVSSFIVSVFPVIANTLAGLLSTDPALRDLFRLYDASPWARLWKLQLPWALPSVMTGLRIAAGLAVIGAIVGEFFAGGGLGIAMQVAIRQQRADLVFAIVLLGSLLGLALFGLVSALSYFSLRHWHASEKGAN